MVNNDEDMDGRSTEQKLSDMNVAINENEKEISRNKQTIDLTNGYMDNLERELGDRIADLEKKHEKTLKKVQTLVDEYQRLVKRIYALEKSGEQDELILQSLTAITKLTALLETRDEANEGLVSALQSCYDQGYTP